MPNVTDPLARHGELLARFDQLEVTLGRVLAVIDPVLSIAAALAPVLRPYAQIEHAIYTGTMAGKSGDSPPAVITPA